MNLALQRRRYFVAMTITTVCVILGIAAALGAVAFRLDWLMWVFAALTLTGFASHGWLMLGVWRDRGGP